MRNSLPSCYSGHDPIGGEANSNRHWKAAMQGWIVLRNIKKWLQYAKLVGVHRGLLLNKGAGGVPCTFMVTQSNKPRYIYRQ